MALTAERIVVYTCVTAGYDAVERAPRVDDVAFVLVTDAPGAQVEGWAVKPLPAGAGSGAMANRFVKMHPDRLFEDCDVSIYIDGNVKVSGDITGITRRAMERGDIALFEHPFRRCAYLEAEECEAIGYDWCWNIRRQIRRYRADGYPAGYGLHEANVMIRRHNAPHVRELMAAWWQEYRQGIRRDQLSLDYLSWKMRVPIVSLGPSEVRLGGRYFSLKEGHAAPAGFARRMRGWVNRRLTRINSLRNMLERLGGT